MSAVLLLIAIILFALQAFGAHVGSTVQLGWLGAAFFAGSFLVGAVAPYVERRAP